MTTISDNDLNRVMFNLKIKRDNFLLSQILDICDMELSPRYNKHIINGEYIRYVINNFSDKQMSLFKKLLLKKADSVNYDIGWLLRYDEDVLRFLKKILDFLKKFRKIIKKIRIIKKKKRIKKKKKKYSKEEINFFENKIKREIHYKDIIKEYYLIFGMFRTEGALKKYIYRFRKKKGLILKKREKKINE